MKIARVGCLIALAMIASAGVSVADARPCSHEVAALFRGGPSSVDLAAFARLVARMRSANDADLPTCARDVIAVTFSAPAYAAPAGVAVRELLRSASPRRRVAAARAMWGSPDPENGAALLATAASDPSPDVVYAAFANMLHSARADIARSGDASAYDTVIARALRSPNAKIAGGALLARAGIHGVSADLATRPYAFDRRPFVRRSAIEAYDVMGQSNRDIGSFLESRLADRDAAVRSAVMLELFRIGFHHAVPVIARIARTARTQAEREEAAEYVRAFARQPELLGPR